MMIPSWVFFATLVAVMQAAMALSLEYFKIRPLHMMWWMRLISFLVLLPGLFFFPFPHDPVFVFYIFLGAVIFSWTDLYMSALAARSGAGVVTRLDPLTVGVTFLLWAAISPSLVADYLAQPLRTAGIVAALAGMTVFALRLRHCEISRKALKIMMPVILMSAVGTIFGKLAIGRLPPPDGVFYYVFLQVSFVLCFYMIMAFLPAAGRFVPHMDLSSRLFDRRTLAAGLTAAAIWLIATPSKWIGIAAVENPAYVTAIGLTAPLWVLLAYRLVKRKEKANIIDGLGIVFCALLLVFLTH